MLPPKLGFHAFFKIQNPIRIPELELDPNPRSGAPKNRIFEKLSLYSFTTLPKLAVNVLDILP